LSICVQHGSALTQIAVENEYASHESILCAICEAKIIKVRGN